MGKKSKFITIHIIPDGTAKTRAFIIPTLLAKALMFTLFICFIATLVSLAKFTHLNLKASAFRYTEAKNLTLTENKLMYDSLLNVIAGLEVKSQTVQKILQNFIVYPNSKFDGKPDQASSLFFSNNTAENYLDKVDSINKKQNIIHNKNHIPDIWPAMGIVSKSFSPDHQGIDIIAKANQIVASTAAGTVIESAYANDLGNFVVAKHSDLYQTTYGHLGSVYVKKGDFLSKGQTIGTIGNTGNSSGPHLHYEILYNKQRQDPLKILSK